MTAYYNEIDPYAAQWLRNLIKAGHIADGEVDTRSIIDVRPDDLREFTQCHFFAGIAGWSYALRLAGWPDDRKIWTGSCPCQPFSAAGKGKGTDDPRHLWPDFFRLIRSCRPQVIMGEQVAGTAGYGWLDGVRSDLESEDYAIEAVDTPACSVNAPHIRQRLFWVSVDNAKSVGQEYREPRCRDEGVNEVYQWRQEEIGSGCSLRDISNANIGNFWNNAIWIDGADSKKRRIESSICLLADGISSRMGKLRAYGNAIVPQIAAEVISSFMDVKGI